LYHSTFIARAGPKHKGRISRFLANKCSIASRIDCYSGRAVYNWSNSCEIHDPFSENPTPKFGEALRTQVEERLAFFDTGAPPSKNADALRRVMEELAMDDDEEDEDAGMEVDEPVLTTLEPEPAKEKKRKRKHDDMDVDGDDDLSLKKVKLSKEEKKLLKKAKKEKAKAEVAANGTKEVGDFLLLEIFLLKPYFRMNQPPRKRTGRQRRRRRKRRRKRKRRNRPILPSDPPTFVESILPLVHC
jgi:nucleolar protein 56